MEREPINLLRSATVLDTETTENEPIPDVPPLTRMLTHQNTLTKKDTEVMTFSEALRKYK